MFKNTASQKVTVYAVDASTGLPKSGDAANITVYLSKDDGSVTQLTDTSATEADATNAKGDYLFDVSQTETNADKLRFTGKSSTSNVVIVPQTIYSAPAAFTQATLAHLDADVSGRMATYTQPTGFLAATFPGTVASTTNITTAAGCAVSSLGASVITAASIAADAITAAKVADGAIDTATFATGTTIPRCTLVDTTTTNTDMITAAGIRTAVGEASANLDTQLSAIAGYIDTEVAAIKLKTDLIPATPAAVGSAMTLTSGERDSIAAALLDLANGVESGKTLRQAVRLMAAALAGKRSNAGTVSEQYDAIGSPGTARVVPNADADGNGTPTLTP